MDKLAAWRAENQLGMQGWTFSHLDGRWESAPLPWDYRKFVEAHLTSSAMWLDMDTGGGELMSHFHHPADKTVVTEGWGPNIKLLQSKLATSKIKLIADPDENLAAVPDETFDVITNSHGATPIAAIVKKLRPGGWFITQQVGATNNFSLSRFLDADYTPAYPDNTLIHVCSQLQDAGMRLDYQAGAFAKLSFLDVGAIVYYATVIPWEFPDFDLDMAIPRLQQLDRLISSQGAVTTFEDRFMIVAQKPA
ncbi:SAM-dependent methyltransferase [Lactiplantibacillus mudanjiangensis]|uniref:SAM-dependent methyltransferase [Lactobacillus paracasei ATCC 334] n=1 Tax=Lactiplantibacillus mudanjiangensis TaxID=1296538 RepID=A0A660E585_9LACO|nr:SAM-dependent methyltransferase [Lactiplantibacillus mudanjiangensis]VDG24393.1 SAM-dependent methyltransferase [Lactobacillus paracasei ATCC 334] [Lactiplantibacillus mudanjiangensis]VDG28195.1 SAM-dependent methyltransferase [Lactobacillus paracasei ATCC 334] [Lactiplantibacillus mudanjiangensis]VDG31151.1 SAM-dependent methyltransferase [Lactobacillus paracasei ATCC 334] [Lactiplantibacillus mudanjiangensis]